MIKKVCICAVIALMSCVCFAGETNLSQKDVERITDAVIIEKQRRIYTQTLEKYSHELALFFLQEDLGLPDFMRVKQRADFKGDIFEAAKKDVAFAFANYNGKWVHRINGMSVYVTESEHKKLVDIYKQRLSLVKKGVKIEYKQQTKEQIKQELIAIKAIIKKNVDELKKARPKPAEEKRESIGNSRLDGTDIIIKH